MPHRWSEAADLRREQIESGLDITFSEVFVPYYRELVSMREPASVLEVGAGTGHLALEIAKQVPVVEAIEPSPGMFRVATDVLRTSAATACECRVEEVSPDKQYDLIVSHLCLQCVSDPLGFLKAIAGLLQRDCLFVFSIPHPCFYEEYKGFFSQNDYKYIEQQSKEVTLAITKDPNRPIEGVPYHHRPLSYYFSVLKAANLYVEDLDEIWPDRSVQQLYGSEWKTPRYVVFYVRRASDPSLPARG